MISDKALAEWERIAHKLRADNGFDWDKLELLSKIGEERLMICIGVPEMVAEIRRLKAILEQHYGEHGIEHKIDHNKE